MSNSDSFNYDAVMLLGFGGPAAPEEIHPFLDNVTRGRPVSRERYEQVFRHYQQIGGRSPYTELTMAQAAALEKALAQSGNKVRVIVGMRNGRPFISEALTHLSRDGARNVLGFIMSVFQCEASWERYQNEVSAESERLGVQLSVDYAPPWFDNPLFIKAVAARINDLLATLAESQRETATLIFTAHSIPLSMAKDAPYVEQFRTSAAMAAAAVGVNAWTIAFQSRSGSPREPWLEPDISEVIRSLGKGTAVVVPIGFLCDHVEVLYDLDIEAAESARRAGVRFARVRTVGDHPAFIRMMASVCESRRESFAKRLLSRF